MAFLVLISLLILVMVVHFEVESIRNYITTKIDDILLEQSSRSVDDYYGI